MEMHARSAEMAGRPATAERYREEAVFLYRSAHDLDPDRSEPILALGRVSEDDLLHRHAIELTLDKKVDDVNALLERARMRHKDEDYELCLKDLNRAVELETSIRTLHDRGVVLYFLGRFEDALNDFDRAVVLEPDNAAMHQWRSNCWRRIFQRSSVRRHREYAIDAINCALKIDPANSQYLQDRSRLLAEEPREYQQAVDELNRLCAEHPDDFTLYKCRGELHLEHRDGAPAAIDDFTRVIELLEEQEAPAGRMLPAHRTAVSMAYRLRSDAHRMYGDFVAADNDLARADEFE